MGVLHFARQGTSGREVIDTTDAKAGLAEALGDGITAPAEASLGLSRVAGTESSGNLGLGQAALVALQTPGGRMDQVLILSSSKSKGHHTQGVRS